MPGYDDSEWRAAAARINELFAEDTARFDSIDRQLEALTRLVEQVLERLPEPPERAS